MSASPLIYDGRRKNNSQKKQKKTIVVQIFVRRFYCYHFETEKSKAEK